MRRWLLATTLLLLTPPVALAAEELAAEVEPGEAVSQIDRDIAAARAAFELASQRNDLEAALQAQRQMVSLLGTAHGNDARELVDPLLQLADLQFAAKKLPAAAQSLERAIAITAARDDIFSYALVQPLSDLASVYNRIGKSASAVEALRRARHITHRKLGILNLEQLDIADQLAESYFQMGQLGEANRENRFAFRVNERQYGPDSPELVPALNKLGAWYERIGLHPVARRNYRRAVELIENAYGPDDLRITDPLRRLARTYLVQDEPLKEGQATLQRAIGIYASNPNADVVEHAGSLVELGDWFMLARRRDKAMEVYTRAWNLITDEGANPEKAEALLGRPFRLRFHPPLTDENMLRGAPEVHIDVSFTVTPAGIARDVQIVGGTAHWQMKRDFRTALHKAKFRPRFENGAAVATEGVTFRYTYVLRGEGTDPELWSESIDGSSDQEFP